MEEITELRNQVTRLFKEVGETSTHLHNLNKKIEDLIKQVGENPALKAAVAEIAREVGQAADELDAIQPKEPTPEPLPVPEPVL